METKVLPLGEKRDCFKAHLIDNEELPRFLREMKGAPKQLFAEGPLKLSELENAVAIVGTRRPTEYGKRFAQALAGFLAERGVAVVSGLALGIDAAAHEGALENGGATVAVLGTGLDTAYPAENRKLFDEIAKRGLLLTEFAAGTPPERKNFPLRNRLIVALSRAVVVVESDDHGGAMITAELARKMGRRLFALPGRVDQPTSRGPHQLIRTGATLITSPEDFYRALHETQQEELPLINSTPPKTKLKRSPKKSTPKAVLPPELSALAEGEALELEELAERSGRPIAELMGLLLQMELQGSITKRLDGRYEAL